MSDMSEWWNNLSHYEKFQYRMAYKAVFTHTYGRWVWQKLTQKKLNHHLEIMENIKKKGLKRQ